MKKITTSVSNYNLALLEELKRSSTLVKKGLVDLKYNNKNYKQILEQIEGSISDGDHLIEAYGIAEQYSEYILWLLFKGGKDKYVNDKEWCFNHPLMILAYLKDVGDIVEKDFNIFKEFKSTRNKLMHSVIYKNKVVDLPVKESLIKLPSELTNKTNYLFELLMNKFIISDNGKYNIGKLMSCLEYFFIVYPEKFKGKTPKEVEKIFSKLVIEKIRKI